MGGVSPRSQGDYQSSPFEISSWEVIGQPPQNEEFVPMAVEMKPSTAQPSDPMFEDFGGRIETDPAVDGRWQNPNADSERRKAEEIKADHELSNEELEAIKAQAYEEGRRAGFEEAANSQVQKLEQIQTRLLDLLKDMKAQLDHELVATSQQAIQLALEVGKKIIGQAVEINPEYIVPLIHEGLKLSGGAVIKKVRVSKQDLEFIEVIGIAKQFKEFDGSWQFEADDTVRAGCIVETSAGEIDFELDKAWERIKDKVVKVAR